jgi:hypothetical protein
MEPQRILFIHSKVWISVFFLPILNWLKAKNRFFHANFFGRECKKIFVFLSFFESRETFRSVKFYKYFSFTLSHFKWFNKINAHICSTLSRFKNNPMWKFIVWATHCDLFTTLQIIFRIWKVLTFFFLTLFRILLFCKSLKKMKSIFDKKVEEIEIDQ